MDYLYLLKHPDLFPYIIGITYRQFEQILPKFSSALQAAEHKKAYAKKRLRAPGGGRKAALKTDRQKLFFILFYYKVYPTYRFAQCLFHFDKRHIQLWQRFLAAVLFESLGHELKLPTVRVKCFSQWIEVCPALKEHLIDATERQIRRPKDKDKQEHFYSGKKKRHTVKNQIYVCPKTKRILGVSAQVEGKLHDEKLFERDPLLYRVPPNSTGMGDSGYQGAEHLHPWIKFIHPQKKPQGKELTNEQKENNRKISQIRVLVEHPFAYLKHFNILSQVFRGQIDRAQQPFVNLACVYNFTRTHR